MVAEKWFHNLWNTKKKHEGGAEKALIGVLAFEVASLMSKLVQLWKLLGDKHVARLREEIWNSVGVRNLVSEDDDYIVGLICIELFENMVRVAKSVARLGKNCADPSLIGFERAISDLINTGADPYGWQFSWKKMERKAKKMERFISISANLYEGMEVLSYLEQNLRRMIGGDELDGFNLLEFHKKVVWKRQEVKNLKEASLWNRSYDYTVLLLARSLFTIYGRIKHVFGVQQMADGESKDSDRIYRSQSVSAILQPSFDPSERSPPRFASGPLGRFAVTSGTVSRKNKTIDFLSGPLNDSSTKSGPLSALMTRVHKLLDAPPETLGAAALALHYANVVIVIEKLVASPHLIGLDARDDLYNMLPGSLRAALRARLKPYSKSLTSAVYDTVLAGEWNEAMAGILEWLAPLAHNNMIRWKSERSFEQKTLVSWTHVLLVQTLYFANQQKIEATIIELLVGLNYVWRVSRDVNEKALLDCDSNRTYDEFLEMDG